MQLEGELVSRAGLQALHPEQFSSILILADQSALFGGLQSGGGSEVMDADSRSLAALLLLRDLQARRMSRPCAPWLMPGSLLRRLSRCLNSMGDAWWHEA